MALPLFKSHWNHNPADNVGEVNDSKDLTIPDMSMSISEMIQKLRIGTLPAEFVREVLYSDSDDFDEITDELVASYDLSDKFNELKRLRAKFERIREMRKKAAVEASPVASDEVKASDDTNVSQDVLKPSESK